MDPLQSTQSQHFLLALCLAPNIGYQKVSKWLTRFSWAELASFNTADWLQLGCTGEQIGNLLHPNAEKLAAATHWLEQQGNHLLCPLFAPLPGLLTELPTPPLALFVQGNLELLTQPQFAIIGSRTASQNGLALAEQFAEQLTDHGFVITSGMAKGIDSAAHQGALLKGQTIAVLGTGPDIVYPKRNRELYQRIMNNKGTIVSPFLPGTGAVAEHFPRRNRIIAGLCQGTLVIEAAMNSGSLITAKYANELNREVFAIPGSPLNVNSQGCNWLIQQGAKLVQNLADILDEVRHFQKNCLYNYQSTFTFSAEEELQQQLWAHLGFEPTTVDTLVQRTGWPVEQVLQTLLDLELTQQVEAVFGGYIKIGRA